MGSETTRTTERLRKLAVYLARRLDWPNVRPCRLEVHGRLWWRVRLELARRQGLR